MAEETDISATTSKQDPNITSSNDDTFITETVTLETSPSNGSNKSKPVALSSMESRTTYLSLSEKQLSSLSSPEIQAPHQAQEQAQDIPPPPMDDRMVSSSRRKELELEQLKTPDTFFRGKNRKRISIRMDATSQAPTEHPMAAVTIGEGADKRKEFQFRVPRTKDLTEKSDNQSQSSDLDKSFAPQIVSVNSDITDPSYGMSSSRRKRQQQQSWKKFRKLRRHLHNSLNSKGNGNENNKSPMSFLDMILDALCSYPGNENGNKT